MGAKRPADKGNPDLRQLAHVPAPPIAEIEKEPLSRLSPKSLKPLKLYEGKDQKKFDNFLVHTIEDAFLLISGEG